MENTNMPTKKVGKVRAGPKSKPPEELTKSVAHYAMIKDIADFGGGDFQQGMIWAREHAAKTFHDYLALVRAKKAKPGKF